MGDQQIASKNQANYDSAWSVEEYTRYVGLNDIERSLVDTYFPAAPARVLDIGCGAGRTSVGLDDRGYRVAAMDLSSSLIAKAHERFPALSFQRMDATRLAFVNESFDAAIFSFNGIDVLFPLASRETCLREVYRVLRPGGTFILSSHNLVGAVFSAGFLYLRGYLNAARWLLPQLPSDTLWQWYVRYEDPGGPQHLYSGPPARTREQLARAGFEVLHTRGLTGELDERRIHWHQQHVHFVARKPRVRV